ELPIVARDTPEARVVLEGTRRLVRDSSPLVVGRSTASEGATDPGDAAAHDGRCAEADRGGARLYVRAHLRAREVEERRAGEGDDAGAERDVGDDELRARAVDVGLRAVRLAPLEIV